jgi:hypothetical protein
MAAVLRRRRVRQAPGEDRPRTASAMAAPQETAVWPELLRVIEAHRAAYGALDQAILRESAAEDAYRGILGFREHMERPLEDYASPKQLKQLRGGQSDNADRLFRKKTGRRRTLRTKRLGNRLAFTMQSLMSIGLATPRDALMAVCSYRCTTLKETRLKAEYLSGDHRLGELLDERHVGALLQSFCEEGA